MIIVIAFVKENFIIIISVISVIKITNSYYYYLEIIMN